MLFSVVIPTHNRLELLRGAIETVRRQRAGHFEIIVFDNGSTDDVGGYVRSLDDPRVRCYRSDKFLPVTDSWNQALSYATGDYITMFGDDDGLVPDYFRKIGTVIDEFNRPDVIYTSLYHFTHPGVIKREAAGCFSAARNGFFFEGRSEPFLLSRAEAMKAVNGSLDLRRNFTFNIQGFAFSREFLRELQADGPVFRSPFPDYYLANVVFAKAKKIVVIPEPLAIAGISKKSFGFTLFNGLEEQGSQLLNTKLAEDAVYQELEPQLLPGPFYDTNYIVTMEHVVRALDGHPIHKANMARYRRLQIYKIVSRWSGLQWLKQPAGQKLWERLARSEKLVALAMTAVFSAGSLMRCRSPLVAAYHHFFGPYDYQPKTVVFDRGGFSHMTDVFSALEAQPASSHDLARSAA